MTWRRPPPEQDQDAALAAWERLEQPAFLVLPYAMLVVAAVLVALSSSGLRSTIITLSIAVAAGAWMLAGFGLHPEWRQRPAWMSAFFVGLAALMAVLVLRSPTFGFFTFTGYFYAFWLSSGWRRSLGVIAIALITATAQDGGLPRATAPAVAFYAGVILINVVVAGSLTWFGWVSAEQNDRRKQAVADLSEANRKLEATLAENAGLHQQLLTQAREAGADDERQRMAREIHDTLAQSLTGIVTQLQAADQAGRGGERRRHLDAAQQLARDGLSEARRSVHALRPEPLQASRIEDALVVVARRWSALHDIRADVATTGSVRPLPADAELTLLRAAQEALANVARHACASRVGLTLSYFRDQVTLDVRDDGIGFTPARALPAGRDSARANGHGAGGFGLVAMRQRVEGLAGFLEIESEPGAGTTISASIPVAAGGDQ